MAIVLALALSACTSAEKGGGVKTGIIGAMEPEVASLKSEMKIASKKTIAGREFCEGTINGNAAAARCAAIVSYMISSQ